MTQEGDIIQVSFIIPTYNEEHYLLRTLECIKVFGPKSLSFEIIVADNGSDDRTTNIANMHAKVLVDELATVGGLRNLAVQSSKGAVLVFLDADVLLTDVWCKNFMSTYKSLLASPFQVTGSRCAIPIPASWIESTWFRPLMSQSSSYINSGHLITTRVLFDEINGFDVTLGTGEDYAFGQSAILKNAIIVNNPLLKVVHEGYPKTLGNFIKREIWHGSGDCGSLKGLFASKVVIVSLVFLFFHLILLLSIVNGSYIFSSISLLLIIMMCFSAAVLKHKVSGFRTILNVGFLYYFYFSARLLSFIPLLNQRASRRETI